MRLFIGIGLPPELAARLARAARTLVVASERSGIRWAPPENLHLTISFLGQVEPARLVGIEQALALLHSPPLQLQLDGADLFQNAGILYANVKPATPLLHLAQQVLGAMETCGFPREQRPYTPHITLARSKGRIHLNEREQLNPAFHQRFEAHEFRLYESLTLPGGAQYEVLRAFSLA